MARLKPVLFVLAFREKGILFQDIAIYQHASLS
jgi:hypothetical protein